MVLYYKNVCMWDNFPFFKSRLPSSLKPANHNGLRAFSIHFPFPNISRFPPFDPRFCTLWGSKRGSEFWGQRLRISSIMRWIISRSL